MNVGMIRTIKMMVRFLKIVYTGMLRNCCSQGTCQGHLRERSNEEEPAHQTLAPGVDNAYEEEGYRKPLLRVLHVEISERYQAQPFRRGNTDDADDGLHRQQQEVHAEVRSRYDELEEAGSYQRQATKANELLAPDEPC